MALRHFDGFTTYNTVGDLSASGLYVVTDPANNLLVLPSGGSTGHGALRFGAGSNAAASIYKTITSSSHVMVGFWFEYTGFDPYSDGYDAILQLNYGANTEIAELILYNSGELAIRIGGYDIAFRSSLITDSPNGAGVNYLLLGSHRIELRVLIDSVAGELELVVDGQIWCQKTNVSTGWNDCDRIYFQTGTYGTGAKFDIDSVYVFDDTGTYNNHLLNDWTTQVLRPAGDSGTPQFTIASSQTILIVPTTITPQTGTVGVIGNAPQVAELGVEARAPDTATLSLAGYSPTVTMSSRNWQVLDDGDIHDADATHTYSTGNAQVDRFVTTDTLEGIICRVQAVNVCCVARRDDAAQNFRTKITHGASTTDGANVALSNPDWKPVIQSYAANPSTGTQWLDSEVEAAAFGYESRA